MNYLRFSILAFTFLALTTSSCKKEPVNIKSFSNYSKTFNDLADRHLSSAQQIGLNQPLEDWESAKKHSKMVKIESNKYYTIEELTHSTPYLVKKAANLLETIGKNFQDSLQSKHAPKYKLYVTSVTRTESDIKKLRKSNANASDNSAHIYGTTFDLAYGRFEKVKKSDEDLTIDQLKSVIAEVLRDLQEANKCYVRYEVKQHCFHITARK